LGADLPAEEIAIAVKYIDAQALTISLSFANDDHVMHKELRRIKKLIGNDVAVIVGGRAAGHYQALLDEIDVLTIKSYQHYREILNDLAQSYAN